MDDQKFLKQAIQNSIESLKAGNFPAGAVVVLDNEIIASEGSSPYPGLFHADSKAVTTAFNKHGQLKNAVLYVGLQPCLMCTGVAYWAGIRKIIFAASKSKVSGDYYETPGDTEKLFASFNEKIEFKHSSELEKQALSVIKEWEKRLEVGQEIRAF